MTRSALRAGGVLAGALIAAAIVGQQRYRAPYTLLPENEGALKCVEVQFAPESPELTECIGAFLRQISDEVEVVAACPDEQSCARFAQLARRWRLQSFKTVNVGKPITGWSKDRFLVTASGSSALLLQPWSKEAAMAARTNDMLVAPAITRAMPTRFQTRELPICFDAGDILATRDWLYVSDELQKKNAGSGFPDRSDLATYLQRSFGLEVRWLKPAPPHHIGMYLAPLDANTVAVGDPDRGRQLWLRQHTADLGKPDFTDRALDPFRAVIEQMEQAGMEVIRLPLIYFAPQVYLTYTNAVFETRGDQRIVYMPVYGDPNLDRAARSSYEKAGWTVRPVPVRDVFEHRGTIGCLVNVLERD